MYKTFNPDETDKSQFISGVLAPGQLGFGDGRLRGLKYYQYSSNSVQIANAHVASELDTDKVDVPFDESQDPNTYEVKFSFYRLWLYTGPGWLMSIAYLDPGNLESDLQAGAIGGYKLIWVLFWATTVGWTLQCLSARLGVVTGRHLAQMCRYEYPRPIATLLWLLCELAIIGSDIQEVVGSAIAFRLLFGWELWVGCLVTACDAFTFLLLNYYGMRYLEALFCILIAVMAGCFGVEFVIGNPDLLGIGEGWLIPTCPSRAIEQAIGMVGAVIMPHNLYLHAALVQTRNLVRRHKGAVREGIFYFTIETAVSLFVSFLINLCIVSVFSKGFYGSDDSDIGLSEAGTKLKEAFGSVAKLVWGIGLLAAGQSSTMTGTFAGQYVMNGFLDLSWAPWKRTLLTRVIALGPALTVALLAKSNLDTLDEWLNVQQSVVLPFAIFPLLFFNSNRRIMGEFALSKKMQIFYWTIALCLIGANMYLIVYFTLTFPDTIFKWAMFGLFVLIYLGFLLYLMIDFFQQKVHRFRNDSEVGAYIEADEDEGENNQSLVKNQYSQFSGNLSHSNPIHTNTLYGAEYISNSLIKK